MFRQRGLRQREYFPYHVDDNWVLRCIGKAEGVPFLGGTTFELVHENTDKLLKMSKYYEYSYVNWENCPFQGQLEVSGADKSTMETRFKIVGGVFFKEAAAAAQEEVEPEN